MLSFCLLLPLAATAADESKLPPGFIAVSEFAMNWSSAKDFCQRQGGRLPLVNDSTSLGAVPSGGRVDGFGTIGGPWPSGLPCVRFWTGTEDAYRPGHSWFVHGVGDYVVRSDRQSGVTIVVCVP